MATSLRTIRLRRLRKQAARSGANRVVRVGLSASAIVFAIILLLPAAAAGAAFGVYSYFAKDLPDASVIEEQFSTQSSINNQFFETTKLYDRTGSTLLYEVIDANAGDRQWVGLSEVSPYLISATVAMEDRSFYTNPGVDVRGLARALWSNLQGQQVQGGSSITQQVIKNTLIAPEERTKVSYERKIKEAILAVELTRRYPGRDGKNKILEWYLNTNYYGEQAYGIQAAARVYFNKEAKDLTLAEASMLVPIPQNPAYTPIRDEREAKNRQALVLNSMADVAMITRAQANAAMRVPLTYYGAERRFSSDNIRAPHYSIYAKQALESLMIALYGPEAGIDLVNRGGLRVYTTLDLTLNDKALEIARTRVQALRDAGKNATNACVVLIRPNTGEILALIGSLDYWSEEKRADENGNELYLQGPFNVCTGLRQPGSSFKPFAYVTALAQGMTPGTVTPDVATVFEQGEGQPVYVPENYDRKFHGPQPLRFALANSYNIPAVWITQQVGVDAVVRTAHRMGITTLDQNLSYYGLAITLGGGEVKALDMAFAFSVFVNGGVMAGQPVAPDDQRRGFRELDPVAILRVEDSQGKILYEYNHPEIRQVLSPQLSWLMTDILSDNRARWPAFGAGNPLELDRPAAVKTGTTNDFRDNWTVGGTPQLVAAIWVGNNDNEEMVHVSGIAGAAPIWHDIMTYYHEGKPVITWTPPDSLVDKYICMESGLLATRQCKSTLETFIAGTEPTVVDNTYQTFLINRDTGKLATVYTPPELIEEKVFPVYPPEYADWVKASDIPQPPSEYDDIGLPGICTAEVALCNPQPYSYVRDIVPLTGNARGEGFTLYRVLFGQGLNPRAWQQIGPDHDQPVDNNLLENWDTNGLDGLYSLQVTAVRGDQSFQSATIQVTVDNEEPHISLVQPVPGWTFSVANDETATFQANALDNISLARVDFYIGSDVVGSSTLAPFTYKWRLREGTYTVTAIAYDAAGNEKKSEQVTFSVGP